MIREEKYFWALRILSNSFLKTFYKVYEEKEDTELALMCGFATIQGLLDRWCYDEGRISKDEHEALLNATNSVFKVQSFAI